MKKAKNTLKVVIEPVLPVNSVSMEDENSSNEDSQCSEKKSSVEHDDLWKSYNKQQENALETEKVGIHENLKTTDKGFSLDDSF